MRNNSAFLSLLLMIFGLSLLLGCSPYRVTVEHPAPTRHPGEYKEPGGGPPPWAPAHGYRAKHQYRYYPGPQIYFDTGRGLYFSYRDGAWRVSTSLPAGINLHGRSSVSLEMDTDIPYIHHSEVVREYPPWHAREKGRGNGRGNDKHRP